ncbi:uncharacterized protein E0L32_004387 [Thyridium curvatum]|uniref:6-phosphogluconate dehydrogenase C-terminal domain-like protein n=1 Tax=Thyridium curvatum TaxID=1093900 RepID=A0A507B6J7_9PEZI|nr:uncharacterized protein E0L32_004387 [Thyridium curvatum]TPX15407.1 hypothetical protein E0L32_004387 [Thyridium curvatum]
MLLSRFSPQAALRPRPGCVRWRSSIHACQSGRFSVLTQGAATKQAILDHIKNDAHDATLQFSHGLATRKSDSAVILASRQYATWLEDPGFMGPLLQQFFGQSQGETTSQEVSVLGAVVDGLCPLQPSVMPRTGFSILHGNQDEILPDLWVGKREYKFRAAEVQASIAVSFRPLLGDFHPLNVTIPLAQTIFQNGRPSTLLATRWKAGLSGSYELQSLIEKDSQVIVPSLASIQAHASVSVPLYPISTPRQIVSGLGNIVRQVDIEGKASPASQELEATIPKLLDRRARLNPDLEPTPLAVWALIIPADLTESYIAAQTDTASDAESDMAEDFARSFSNLFASGCHLHRVLSGGGGWGAKQGLLSLDPQTRYMTAGNEDIESFISSFRGESTSDSIVTPGNYIQFFVQPMPNKTEELAPVAKQAGSMPSIAFGTHAGPLDDLVAGAKPSITVVDDHFGAVTSHGIYIEPKPDLEHQVQVREGTHTKIDAPNSYIWEGVGILSIGDMGLGIAKLLIAKGFTIATNCKGRSQDTVSRAKSAKVTILDSDTDLVNKCDVILSVVPPRDAVDTAQRVFDAAQALEAKPGGRQLYFADMNAVAPSTCKAMAATFAKSAAPIRFVDGCILGGPPAPPSSADADAGGGEWSCPLMPTSGPHDLAQAFPLLAHSLRARHISDAVGAASGLKMCFASMSKGYAAIATQAFTTAHRLGVLPELQSALGELAPARARQIEASLAGMPPKAYRWVREMEEISLTFAEEGGFEGAADMFRGAAEVYRTVAEETVLGKEKVGDRKRGRTGEDVAAAMAEGIERKRKKRD